MLTALAGAATETIRNIEFVKSQGLAQREISRLHDSSGLAASLRQVNFGSVVVGNQGQTNEYIYNPTTSSVTIASVTLSNPDFRIVSPSFPVTVMHSR